jgi:hypothetical protein
MRRIVAFYLVCGLLILITLVAIPGTLVTAVKPTFTATPNTSKTILRVFVRGADGLLYQKQFIDGNWTDWTSMPVPRIGISGDSPSVVSAPDGRIDLFVRGNDNALWHKTFWPDAHESDWASLGGNLTSGPAAVRSAAGSK